MTEKNVLTLRFAGFTDAWERKAPVEVLCDFQKMVKKSATVGGDCYNG